jgi:large subunit ribosomal protein L24
MQKQERVRIKKEDKVKIITGKDRGKIGKVIRVDNKKNRLLVEKANMIKRHVKPSVKNPQGGIIEGEGPIHWSNVMIICSSCLKPARIRMTTLENGNKVRVCSKCNENLDSK